MKADPEAPSFLANLRWSLVMLLATLALAAIGIPLMRWLGVEPRADTPQAESRQGSEPPFHG